MQEDSGLEQGHRPALQASCPSPPEPLGQEVLLSELYHNSQKLPLEGGALPWQLGPPFPGSGQTTGSSAGTPPRPRNGCKDSKGEAKEQLGQSLTEARPGDILYTMIPHLTG